MAVTLAEAQAQREKAKAAYETALNAVQVSKQGASGGGMTVTRQTVDALRREFLYWDGVVSRLSSGGGGIRVRRGVPL